jgi:hypothetical protein
METARESEFTRHAVEKHVRRACNPATGRSPDSFIEQDIGREGHIRRAMPVLLMVRKTRGTRSRRRCCRGRGKAVALIAVGRENGDSYGEHTTTLEPAKGDRASVRSMGGDDP